MAKMTTDFDGLDAFIAGVKGMTKNVDADVDEVLDSVSGDLVSAFQSNIRSVTNRTDEKGRPYSTGALASSISATKAKKNSYGHFVAARPTGTDKNGTRNGEKLAYLEYGTPKQAARPVIARTVAQVEAGITSKIKNAFEAKVNQYVGG